MIKTKEKYLRIPPPPQIHKLFKDFRNQVRELFSFSNKVRTIVDKYINEIFRYFKKIASIKKIKKLKKLIKKIQLKKNFN